LKVAFSRVAFFAAPIPAAPARQVGTWLLREAIALRRRMDLSSYDRLFPSQDVLQAGGLGNLIAAPLQGAMPTPGRDRIPGPGHPRTA